MMNLFIQTLILGALVSFLYFFIQTWRNGNKSHSLPPGPPRLPVIGNLFHFVTSTQHIYLHELSKTYGPLISLKLGSIPTIVISSAKVAKEAMKTHDLILSNRPKLATHQKLSYSGSDVAFSSYGEQWRQLRKVCVLHLFSHKKVKAFYSIREEEVYQMVQKISRMSDESKVVNLSEMMMCLTSNVVCKIAFGSSDYVVFKRSFTDVLKDAQELFVTFCFSDYFSFMDWVDKLIGTSAHLHKVFMELDHFYENIINEHLKSPKLDGQGDMVDVLLDLQRDSSIGISITMDHIKALLLDIFSAGTETSAASVIWTMTELIKNPNSMKRAQEEVRSLVGTKSDGIVREEDLEKLVYLKAVVKESFRLHPVAPLLVPRETTQKCNIQGYEIEEKTLVYVNAWAIGRDPESWENPEEFSPERFLGKYKDIDFIGQDFELIPFGFGRRICPGMQMGVVMVELALANLICLFDWEVPEGMGDQVMDASILPGIATHKKIPLCLATKRIQE